jgi:hypothetical protein
MFVDGTLNKQPKIGLCCNNLMSDMLLMEGQKEHEAWKSFPTQSLQKEKMLTGINLLDT